MIEPIRPRNRVCALLIEADAVRPVGVNEKDLPAVGARLNDMGPVDSIGFSDLRVHASMVNKKLNERKGQ